MKTLRFPLQVVDVAHLHALLDLATSVEGVMAALVDAEAPELAVMVRSDASALLVREELRGALAAGWTSAALA